MLRPVVRVLAGGLARRDEEDRADDCGFHSPNKAPLTGHSFLRRLRAAQRHGHPFWAVQVEKPNAYLPESEWLRLLIRDGSQ
jgi:hypothetical protein